MVSKARLDLPEPERPVTTIRRSRGSSSETFFRLWTRAPWTAMVVRAVGLLMALASMEEGELLDVDIASLGKADGQRDLADEAAVGEVLAGGGDTLDAEVALEVVFDLGDGAGFADFAEVVEDGAEEGGDAVGDIAVDGGEGGLDCGAGLLRVQEIGVDGLEEGRVELECL